MKKNIIGVSIAMLFAANAMAQSTAGSSVELYGVLDAGVANAKYSLNADPTNPGSLNTANSTKVGVVNSNTAMINGGIQASRFGFRGTENLGGGLKAIFTLESCINVGTGSLCDGAKTLATNKNATTGTASGASSQSGQLFARQAWVGLSDNTLGTLTFGRQYAPIFDIVVAYDPVQAAQLFSPLGFSGSLGGGGGLTENARQDNSVKYKNKFGDFNIGAMYKFGGVAGKSTAASNYAVNAGYDAYGFGIQAAYQSAKDTLSGTYATGAGTVNVTNYNSDAFMVAGKYAFGDATVKAGYESFTLKQPSDSFATLNETTYYGYGITTATDFAGADRKTNVMWVGGDYNFTPAFNLAVGFYDVNYKASSDVAINATTGAVTNQANGNWYAYSLLADYHFTKRTDAYAGLMYSQFKGAQFPSSVYNTSNSIIGVGLRHKF